MDRRMKILRGAAKARQALDLHATPPKEVPMNAAQSIRAFAALTALGLVAGPATQALATISDPATGQTMVGSDVVAPMPSVRVETGSKSKVPLIRVAPTCSSCED